MSKYNVGDTVKHKFRENMVGKIVKIHDGCNCIYEVDFECNEFISCVPDQDIELITVKK